MVNWSRLRTLVGVSFAAVPLAGRVVPVVSPGRDSDWTILLLLLAYPVAALGAALLAGGSVVMLVRGSRAAVGPLLLVLVAVAILAAPLEPVLRELDDRLNRVAREEIVRRLETGELARPQWQSVPPGRLVPAPQHGQLQIPVPGEFSGAVSSQRLLRATFDPSLTRVVFQPHGGIGNRLWAIVYDHNDIAPAPGDSSVVWWQIHHVERLREHWYRVIAE